MITRFRSKTLCNFWIFPLAVLFFFMQGCATTTPPPPDPLAYKNRTKSSVSGDVKVTVAVPTIAEAQAIYGVELAAKHIQPVWLEVKNDSTDTYWFLPSGLDPDYFPPSEAAFALYTDSDETNRQLDENYGLLLFSDQVIPGAVILGYVNDEKQGDKLNQPLPMHDPSLRIILVTGAFAECFPKMGKPYQDAAVRLEKLGYRIDTIVVGGRSSSRYNAAMIARTVNGWEPRANERLILLGYSKGATDILHFLVDYPEIAKKVTAVLSVAGVINGTPLADKFAETYAHWFKEIPTKECEPGDGGVLISVQDSIFTDT